MYEQYHSDHMHVICNISKLAILLRIPIINQQILFNVNTQLNDYRR